MKEMLCHSNAGNEIQILTITNFLNRDIEDDCRKAVVLMARAHPSDT